MKCKDPERIQYFNGLRFVQGTDKRYFKCNQNGMAMHRYVWQYYNGPIPEGYVIHHKDGNKANNDITNLECIPRGTHSRLHGQLLTDEQRDWRRNNINTKARPKAIEWHKSEEGRKWHKEQAQKQVAEGKNYNANLQPILYRCDQCGKEVYKKPTQGSKQHHTFCSGACHQKYRRQHGLNRVEKICPVCGNTYLTDKYSPRQTCGHSCANKLRWQEGGCFYNKRK